MIFTFAFVRLERPSAPGPGSVTAVDIAASSSSVSSTRAFFEAGWVDAIEVALRARFRFFVRELPFFRKPPSETGEQKGLQQTLEERGFDVRGLRAKCTPVCPFENDGCCMARLLSKQDDFANQISVLETVIREAGHECIFLPKFHCELDPIEMVCLNFSALI